MAGEISRSRKKSRDPVSQAGRDAPHTVVPEEGARGGGVVTAEIGEKHDLILQTAAECFSRKGYDATSLEDIAKRVKLHKATLYHYVESKHDILYQCLTRSFRDYDFALDQMRDDGAPALDRMRGFFRALAAAQGTVYGRCLTGVGAQGLGHEPGSRIRSFRRRLDYAFRALLEEGIDRGEIRPCPVPEVSALIFGAFNWVGTWHRPEKGLSLEQIAEDFLDIAIDGLSTSPGAWIGVDALAGTVGLTLPLVRSGDTSAEPSDKRGEILCAAAGFFTEKGYEGTSLEDIAGQVKLHKATLYHYVSGKGDLVYQCLERSFGDLDEVIRTAEDRSIPPVERFAFFLRHMIEAQNSDFGRCLNLIQPEVLPEKEADRFRRFKSRLDHVARSLLGEAMERGDIHRVHPVTAAAFVFGASNWVPHWRKPERDLDLKALADVFLQIYFAGIRAR